MSIIKWLAAAGLVTIGGWMFYRQMTGEEEEEDISQWTAAAPVAETRQPEIDLAAQAGETDTAPSYTSACPQDLSAVKGVGRVYERKLYAAGIGSYWQLANLSADALAELVGVQDFQGVDLAAIRVGAQELAESTDSVGRVWDGGQADALTAIEGLGETYERRLFEAGICTYAALAAADPARLAEICQAPDWRRPDYAAWIAEAGRLGGGNQ